MSRQISAAELATEAQNFGQEDDILVLSIQRMEESVRNEQSEPELTAI
jgi:hypothetical protein